MHCIIYNIEIYMIKLYKFFLGGGSIKVSHLSALKRKMRNILFTCYAVVKKRVLCGFQLIKISKV